MTTFHQAKGLERKIVIVLGFDDSYNKYFNRSNINNNEIANPVYVAVSRASE